MKQLVHLFLAVIFLSQLSTEGWAAWKPLDKGLELGIFSSSQPSEIGDSLIRILRISPKHYRLVLLNVANLKQPKNLTAKNWGLKYKLVAAINAGMYQKDNRTSISLMKTRSYVNNNHLSKAKTVLAFDKINADVPEIKIIDRQCEDFSTWKKKYSTFVQSIRMISCTGQNVWQAQPSKWSTSAIAVDLSERVLLIHARSPYRTHDFINILKQLPIGISRAMYLEGGSEAQLFININGREYEFLGMSEANFNGSIHNESARPIPNVIGLVPISAPRTYTP